MTDAEFLDELQRRAAEHLNVFLSQGQRDRLSELCDYRAQSDGVPAGIGMFAFGATAISCDVTKARELLANRVKQRLLGKL